MITSFKKLWIFGRANQAEEFAYHIVCLCGGELTGQRRITHQVIVCPHCQRKRFVLPCSPFPVLEAAPANSVAPSVKPMSPRFWLLPLGAALLTGLLLWVIGSPFLDRSPQIGNRAKPPESVPASDRLKRIQAFMRQGHFRLAAQEVESANESFLENASPAERQRWTQLGREAAVYADLLAEPLEELLDHALHTSEAEWLAEFSARYRGKAILFDAHVWRDPSGAQIDYEVRAGEKSAHLALDELAFVKGMERNEPARVIFAARLASLQLEPPGPRWVVRFLPNSDVLLTDAVAAALCCPPLADAESQEVLRRQMR